jgi:hypothetical protein
MAPIDVSDDMEEVDIEMQEPYIPAFLSLLYSILELLGLI